MAKIVHVNKKSPRIKKWEHFKLKFRIYLYRSSVLMNALVLIYFLNENGTLTTIKDWVNPILEALKNNHPF